MTQVRDRETNTHKQTDKHIDTNSTNKKGGGGVGVDPNSGWIKVTRLEIFKERDEGRRESKGWMDEVMERDRGTKVTRGDICTYTSPAGYQD